MSEQIIEIFTSKGHKVGFFTSPSVKMHPNHNYQITGQFLNSKGELLGKIEYNPQVLPYHADISNVTKCGHKQIVEIYVQRGRQPVLMTGICQTD